MKKLAIVGAGAAGIFAAANLAKECQDLQIEIFESGRRSLAKVEISGGGRCNLTNGCNEISKLVQSYPRGSKELIGPFNRFATQDVFEWFSSRGVELKVEGDGRVFPVSNDSRSIIDCLNKEIGTQNLTVHFSCPVLSIKNDSDRFILVTTGKQFIDFDFVILTTGGSKNAYQLATSFGHSITSLAPSLFTFKSSDSLLKDLSGISFDKCLLELNVSSGKKFYQEGPLLITHWGLSGPAVLKLSAFAARELFNDSYKATLKINWIGKKDRIAIEKLIMSSRTTLASKLVHSNSQFSLPKRFWENLLSKLKIPENLKFAELSNFQVTQLVDFLCACKIEIEGKGEFKEEFVTCGGVNLKEINFKSFESKLVPNLFMAGEILDIDGITGGFNFQAAWTGAWIISQAIKERI